jgi:cullin 1
VKYHQLPLLEDSGNRKFKTIVFDEVKMSVCNSIIRLIDSEREGGVIDRGVVRNAVEIFEDMGMGSLDTYVADLEEPFLAASRNYFNRKSEEWVEGDPLPIYLRKAEKFMEEEKARVTNYLNSETEAKLMKVFDQEILEKRQSVLLEKEGSGCKVMLSNDLYDDLARLFRLFSRLPDSLTPIADIFRQHVIDCGEEKIDQRMSRLERGSSAVASDKASASASATSKAAAKEGGEKEGAKEGGEKENVTNDDPQFIRDLLSVHEKYIKVVNEQFSGHASFQKALKDAFVDIVNRDVGKVKTADLMGAFCDRLLKAGSGEKLSDSEIEDNLERCVQLFSYLTDKDLFGEIYRNLLAKRLLNQRSASDDMERLMISKLKIRCGSQFTAKMEGMLTDLSIGNDTSASFQSYCRDNESRLGLGKIDFSVLMLTAGHWPTFKAIDASLNQQMMRCCQVYKEYFDAHNSHRKLAWVHSQGSANVKATLNKKSYDLQVTTLQAVILLAFNAGEGNQPDNNGTRSFEALASSTNVGEEVLKRVLHSLAAGKIKILKRLPAPGESAAASGGIRNNELFQVNESFSSPMRKIRIPMSSLDDNQTAKKVEEDRTIAVEAAIVRIMKARKTLQHQQLVAEVLTQLSFFKPDPKLVKRRIEALIDREYLEREPNAQNVYRYLA